MASVGEGACSSDPQTQAVLGNWGTGGARHSVRAVPGDQVTWVGNRGGQGTARPTADFYVQADRFVITSASVARVDRIYSGG